MITKQEQQFYVLKGYNHVTPFTTNNKLNEINLLEGGQLDKIDDWRVKVLSRTGETVFRKG